MSNFFFGFIVGLIAAEALYLFRKIIASWTAEKVARAQAAITAATTPKP